MIGYVTAGYLTANGFAVSVAFYAQVWAQLLYQASTMCE